MANKPLTADEWRDSVQQIWDEAIRDSIQDQIREAVLAEREACVEVCKYIADDAAKKQDFHALSAAELCIDGIRARGQ